MSLGAPALNAHKVCLAFLASRNVQVITVQLCLLNKNPLRHYVYARSETLKSYIHVHKNICVFFLSPQNICAQYGVDLTFITHVEKCILCLDCYSNTGHLKNIEFCSMLLWRTLNKLNTRLVSLAGCLTLCATTAWVFLPGLCVTLYLLSSGCALTAVRLHHSKHITY